MKYVKKQELAIDALPGRGLLRAIGKDSYFASDQMSVGYALYQADYGMMEPHQHAEETVIITKAKKGWVSWGAAKEQLTQTMRLEEGMILHIPDKEWHAFTYEEGGFVEIIFIYSGTANVRPEDK